MTGCRVLIGHLGLAADTEGRVIVLPVRVGLLGVLGQTIIIDHCIHSDLPSYLWGQRSTPTILYLLLGYFMQIVFI